MRYLHTAAICCCAILAACASSGTSGSGTATAAAKTKTNPDFIATSEINAGTYRDAYDIVQRLRPNWFTKARASSGGGLSGTQVSGSSAVQSGGGTGLVVYLDNNRMGGPEALRDMSASAIGTLQYMRCCNRYGEVAGDRIQHRQRSDRRDVAFRALALFSLSRSRHPPLYRFSLV